MPRTAATKGNTTTTKVKVGNGVRFHPYPESDRGPGKNRADQGDEGKLQGYANRLSRSEDVGVHAFNVNHLGGEEEATHEKIEALDAYLRDHNPDILSLTEVNNMDSLREHFESNESYALVESREMVTGSTPYAEKRSHQFESYPVLVRKESGLQVSLAGVLNVEKVSGRKQRESAKKLSRSWGGDNSRSKNATPWSHFRPLQIFAVTHPDRGSVLMAPTHTSPSSAASVGKQTVRYAEILHEVAIKIPGQSKEEGSSQPEGQESVPSLLFGDFYTPRNTEELDPLGDFGLEVHKPGRAKREGARTVRQEQVTNIAKDQDDSKKSAADFFIASEGMVAPDSARAVNPPGISRDLLNPAREWENRGISDHAPVAAGVQWDNKWKNHSDFLKQAQLSIKAAGGQAFDVESDQPTDHKNSSSSSSSSHV